jgi:DNA-binding MarR family transcriptional regulator/GNAT superfamily N-acetyltransferase
MLVGVASANQMRDFNRFYTQTIGILTDRYLGQKRPLGEARLLFEIGLEGSDVRELRERLGLDSGYLSRLLRALESAGLVCTRQSASDTRVRTAILTSTGRSELSEMNDRASTVARHLLEPLSLEQRTELLDAMTVIRRRLRLSLIDIAVIDPASADAQGCLSSYAVELSGRFPEGYSENDLIPTAQARDDAGAFVVARESSHAVGCGVLRTLAPDVGELRHLWIAPDARGLGLARRLLLAVEHEAVSRGHRVLRLDTHRVLTEAINLYRTSGYQEIAAYDENPHAHLWFEKTLGDSAPRP